MNKEELRAKALFSGSVTNPGLKTGISFYERNEEFYITIHFV